MESIQRVSQPYHVLSINLANLIVLGFVSLCGNISWFRLVLSYWISMQWEPNVRRQLCNEKGRRSIQFLRFEKQVQQGNTFNTFHPKTYLKGPKWTKTFAILRPKLWQRHPQGRKANLHTNEKQSRQTREMYSQTFLHDEESIQHNTINPWFLNLKMYSNLLLLVPVASGEVWF